MGSDPPGLPRPHTARVRARNGRVSSDACQQDDQADMVATMKTCSSMEFSVEAKRCKRFVKICSEIDSHRYYFVELARLKGQARGTQMEIMNDAQLVCLVQQSQTQQGRCLAYEELVERWAARVLAYVRSIVCDGQAAEDLTQEALLRGFKRISSLSQPDRFGAWLFRIARHAAIDWQKSKKRCEVQLTELAESSMAARGDFTSESDHQGLLPEQKQQLREAIDQLPPAQREAVLIYYYDEVTYRQLAEMLGITSAAVNARLTKARTTLRKKLGTNWCSHES